MYLKLLCNRVLRPATAQQTAVLSAMGYCTYLGTLQTYSGFAPNRVPKLGGG